MLTAFLLAAVVAAPAAPSRGVDHSAFDALLRRHVTAGLVDYDAFAGAPEFRAYLHELESARLEGLSASERLAFWINAYNAWTIELINAHEERDSIRNVNKTLGLLPLKGPWSERIVRAAGRALTLDDVEHGIIRKEFDEPRIHFALVCAALGCPPLRSEAFTAARLEEQLDDQARVFLVESPHKNRVDVEEKTLWASSILTWYQEDFGGSDEALGRYVAAYWPDGPERALLLSGDFRVRKTDYDWTLNSVEKGRSRPTP